MVPSEHRTTRSMQQRKRWPGRHVAIGGMRRFLTQELEVRGFGLVGRLHTELVGKHGSAAFIRAEGCAAAAGAGMCSHRQSVSRLSKGVGDYECLCCRERFGDVPTVQVSGAECVKCSKARAVELSPILIEPSRILSRERGLGQDVAGELRLRDCGGSIASREVCFCSGHRAHGLLGIDHDSVREVKVVAPCGGCQQVRCW